MVAIPLRFTFSSSLPPLLPPPLPPPFLSISSAFSDRSLVPIYTTGCRIFWIVNFRETYIESFWLIIGSHLVATSFISHPSSAPHPYLPHYSTLSPPPPPPNLEFLASKDNHSFRTSFKCVSIRFCRPSTWQVSWRRTPLKFALGDPSEEEWSILREDSYFSAFCEMCEKFSFVVQCKTRC